MLGGGDPGSPSSTATGTTTEVQATPEEERMVDFVDAVAGDDAGHLAAPPRQRLPAHTRRALPRRHPVRLWCRRKSPPARSIAPPTRRSISTSASSTELSRRFGAPGDFAQAYVIAHEFGHHVQNLLGTNERVRATAAVGANSASVALELQADCYAGIWGHEASQGGRFQSGKVELEPGDAEEALRAAAVDRRRSTCRRCRLAGCSRSGSRTARRRSAWSGSSAG